MYGDSALQISVAVYAQTVISFSSAQWSCAMVRILFLSRWLGLSCNSSHKFSFPYGSQNFATCQLESVRSCLIDFVQFYSCFQWGGGPLKFRTNNFIIARERNCSMTMYFDSCHLSKTLLNATSSLKNLLIKSELIFSSLTRPLFCTSVITISPLFYHFPCGSAGKEYACNVGHLDSIPGLGRFPWRRERLHTPVFWPREFHDL